MSAPTHQDQPPQPRQKYDAWSVRLAMGAPPVADEKGDPAKLALWGEEKLSYSRNFPLAENGAL